MKIAHLMRTLHSSCGHDRIEDSDGDSASVELEIVENVQIYIENKSIGILCSILKLPRHFQVDINNFNIIKDHLDNKIF